MIPAQKTPTGKPEEGSCNYSFLGNINYPESPYTNLNRSSLPIT